MTKWQCVYKTEILHRAEIVKAVLEGNEISPMIINKKETAYQLMGHYEIHVMPDNVLEALKIIRDEIVFE
jgi:hypothetical protein